jgi:succinate-acetate transporter protein
MFAASIALLVLLLVENLSESVLLVKSAASVAMMLAALACLPAASEVLNDRAGDQDPILSDV